MNMMTNSGKTWRLTLEMADFSAELESFIPVMDVFTVFSPTRYFYAGCNGLRC
jgi:hypothetical protein